MARISNKLIESIKILEGKIFHIELHNQRMNHSGKKLFGLDNRINLQDHINIPETHQNGLVKCRIIYSHTIETIHFEHYQKRNIRKFKIVHDNDIDYRYKYTDRSAFEKLKRGLPDDTEIIIIKNGYVTDTSYTNILLFNGKEWHTPHSPLLEGVQRAHLLAEKRIKETMIKPSDLTNYTEIQLINALLDFDTNTLKLPLQQNIVSS